MTRLYLISGACSLSAASPGESGHSGGDHCEGQGRGEPEDRGGAAHQGGPRVTLRAPGQEAGGRRLVHIKDIRMRPLCLLLSKVILET